MEIRIKMPDGSYEVVVLGRKNGKVTSRRLLATIKRDEEDKWPSGPRAADAMLHSRKSEVPSKRWTKTTTKATDPRVVFGRTGPGSDSTKGPRAYAGMLRAIAAEHTGCIEATEEVEKRLREHVLTTTDPSNDGMRFTDLIEQFQKVYYGA